MKRKIKKVDRQCRACVHGIKDTISEILVCTRTNDRTGEPISDNITCDYQRSTGWLATKIKGTCGKEGQYFESIEPEEE